MEHRQLFRTSPMFETDHDQNRNHIQSSMHLGSVGAADGGSYAFCVENMLPGAVNLSSNWNSTVRPIEYVPSTISTEPTHNQVPIPGLSYHPFRQPSAVRNFLPVAQSYADRPSSSHYSASSSNHYGHSIHGYEDGNTSSNNGRAPYKRKRTVASVVHSVGSSSEPTSFLQKPNSGSQHWPWEVVSVTPSNRGGSLSIVGEASQRNVRSRSTLDLDVNQARAPVLTNPPRYSHSAGRLMNRPGVADHVNLSASANSREWNHHTPVPSSDLGRIVTGPPSASSHDIDHFRLGSNRTTGSLEIDSYHPNLYFSRTPVVPPQYIQFSGTPTARGGRSSYVQRTLPAYRVPHNYQRLEHVATSTERVVPLSYSRPPPMMGWRNTDRSGRLRIPYQRSSPLSTSVHDRLGFMMVEHPTLYDSRTLLDQHRDMRLDVDNMSYEELLALEERIGNVSTGLSEDTMSKCLRERMHYSSEEDQEESSCVICLEEYKNKDVVATLGHCGHDYHSSCIKKWLSMKKVCPICKAPVLEDG